MAKRKTRKKKKSGNRGRDIVLGIVLGLTAIIALCALGGFVVGKGDTIHPNITVGGVSLDGMTQDEATAALTAAGYSGENAEPVTVDLPGNFNFMVTADDIGLSQTPEEAAAAAYAVGHSGEPFKDLLAYIKCITGNADAAANEQSVDKAALSTLVKSELSDFEAFATEVKIDEDAATLTVLKGGDSINADADELAELIINAFTEGESSVYYSAGISSAAAPDFDALRNEIRREPKNAEYDSVNHCLTQSQSGLDFDTDKAASLYDKTELGELVVIPLTLTAPALSTDTLGTELFADCLGSKTTTFKSSNSNRCTNVRLAAEKIDGVVLNPGETFSFNDVVGKRTAAAGFKPAGAYAGGEEVQQIGGGICQVSSTLYCSALLSNLQITSRSCHYFAVSYVPYGLDATVSWGGPEFKFKNNRDYPIKIVAKCDINAKSLTVEIWGTDVDGTYVEMTYAASTVYDTQYPDVAIGTNATSYRSVYAADGTLISKTKEASSYYHYHKENIKWPDEASPSPSVAPTPTPSPEVTPTPTPSDTPAPQEP